MESDLTGTCCWPGKDEVETEAVAGRRERGGVMESTALLPECPGKTREGEWQRCLLGKQSHPLPPSPRGPGGGRLNHG